MVKEDQDQEQELTPEQLAAMGVLPEQAPAEVAPEVGPPAVGQAVPEKTSMKVQPEKEHVSLPDATVGRMAPAMPKMGAEGPPKLTEPEALPSSVMGDKVAPGSMISPDMMHQAGKLAYKAEMPQVNAAPGSADYFEQKQQQMDYKQAHPWGSMVSEHPGVFGKILHGLATAGNIAGDIVAPTTMSLIPGTQLHNDIESHRNLSNFNKAAAVEAKNNPKDTTGKTPEEITLHDLMTGQNGAPRINPETGKPYTYLEAYGTVNQAKQDVKPEKDPELGNKVDGLNKAFTDRFHVLHPNEALRAEYTLPANATKSDFDRVDKLMEAEERATGTKAQQDTTNQMRRDAAQAAAQNHSDSEADRHTQQTNSIYERVRQPYVQSLGKLHDQLQSAEMAAGDLKAGTPVGQALGVIKSLSSMAGGMGSGVRITQAELNSLASARTGGSYAQWVQHITTGKALTDDQVQQLHGLISDVQQRAQMKEHVLNHGLDTMNYATSPDDIKKADTMIRKNMTNIEKMPAGAGLIADPGTGEPIGYVLPNGKRVAF